MKTYEEWRYGSIVLDFVTIWRRMINVIHPPLYFREEHFRYQMDGPHSRSGLLVSINVKVVPHLCHAKIHAISLNIILRRAFFKNPLDSALTYT
jgi:hypothetical protein